MINKIHEHLLRIILDDEISSFADMLGKNIDITNHQRNIQVLVTEPFKIMNNLAPPIMDNTFTPRLNNFNLRNFQDFATERKKTVKGGLKTVNYYCPQF